jgi:dolichol-phosphate mannosyltransferase
MKERQPHVAVVVPTFREAPNIHALVRRLASVRDGMVADLDLVIVDDRSNDGTRELVQALQRDPSNLWIQFLERDQRTTLSDAVLAGFGCLNADVYVVMDADLSHPPERIPEMVDLVWRGDEEGPIGMVLGSRYAAGGSTDEDWGFVNQVNSRVATALARVFTSVSDPMTGFFAIRRDVLDRSPPLKPVGYKIALELMVRAPVGRVVEVAIQFAVRSAGKSKTGFRQRLLFLKHLGGWLCSGIRASGWPCTSQSLG